MNVYLNPAGIFIRSCLVAKGRAGFKANGVLTYLVNAIEKKFDGNGSSLDTLFDDECGGTERLN